MKKSILLTNLEMRNLAGSEIDTLTIAKYFLAKNYDVTIFTLGYDYPLKNQIEQTKIKVITPLNINKLNKNYDLIWAHHFPLLDYLIFSLGINAKKIIYISLSSIMPIESAPLYWQSLTQIMAISEKTKELLISQGLPKNNILIFPNYAPESYFKEPIKKLNKLKRICIVSNHVQPELKEMINLAKKENIIVDIIGLEYKTIYVDDNLLKDYDAIISIGKTCNYSIALGIPTYCYDHFGGPGYINLNNYQEAFNWHFSGRSSRPCLKAPEILKELITDFDKTKEQVEEVRKLAFKDFCFEKNISNVIKLIEKSKEVDLDKIRQNYYLMARNSEVFINYYEELLSSYDRLKESNKNNEELNTKLNKIYNSVGYRILIKFYNVKNAIKNKKRKST